MCMCVILKNLNLNDLIIQIILNDLIIQVERYSGIPEYARCLFCLCFSLFRSPIVRQFKI